MDVIYDPNDRADVQALLHRLEQRAADPDESALVREISKNSAEELRAKLEKERDAGR